MSIGTSDRAYFDSSPRISYSLQSKPLSRPSKSINVVVRKEFPETFIWANINDDLRFV